MNDKKFIVKRINNEQIIYESFDEQAAHAECAKANQKDAGGYVVETLFSHTEGPDNEETTRIEGFENPKGENGFFQDRPDDYYGDGLADFELED